MTVSFNIEDLFDINNFTPPSPHANGEAAGAPQFQSYCPLPPDLDCPPSYKILGTALLIELKLLVIPLDNTKAMMNGIAINIVTVRITSDSTRRYQMV